MTDWQTLAVATLALAEYLLGCFVGYFYGKRKEREGAATRKFLEDIERRTTL